MPAVMSPAPGGVTYYQMLDLLRGVHQKAGLAGLSVVEFVPHKDINHFGAITAMRIIWNFIGQIGRENKRDK
jgi:agmatinase